MANGGLGDEYVKGLLKDIIPNSDSKLVLNSGESVEFTTTEKIDLGFSELIAPVLGGDAKEVPLVFYRGVQRVKIGTAIVHADGTVDAVLTDNGIGQFSQALRGRELTQMSFGFSVPVLEEDIQFVPPGKDYSQEPRPNPDWSGWPVIAHNDERPLPDDPALD